MKKFILFFAAILISTMAFSQVNSDYDKSTDFSVYKTYTFDGWQKDSGQKLNDIDKKNLLDAFKAEFTERGMTLDTVNPDAHFTLYIVLNKKSSTTAYTNYVGGLGYGFAGGWGMGYGGVGLGSATTTYSTDDYTEGTLVVDMYGSKDKTLIWQGTSTSVVESNESKRDKTIPKKVDKLMKEYPIQPQK